jgi:hypothetical protein
MMGTNNPHDVRIHMYGVSEGVRDEFADWHGTLRDWIDANTAFGVATPLDDVRGVTALMHQPAGSFYDTGGGAAIHWRIIRD